MKGTLMVYTTIWLTIHPLRLGWVASVIITLKTAVNLIEYMILIWKEVSWNIGFQPFDFERTWWRLFQKRVVHTKFDIYVFIVLFVKTLMQYRNAVEWQRIQFFFFG